MDFYTLFLLFAGAAAVTGQLFRLVDRIEEPQQKKRSKRTARHL